MRGVLLLILSLSVLLTGCLEEQWVTEVPPNWEGGMRDASVSDTGNLIDAITDCPTTPTNDVAACPTIVGVPRRCEGSAHVRPPDNQDEWADVDNGWMSDPPTSGQHFPFWQSCWGEQQWVLPRAMYIHNMEHGGIVLAYNCPEGCDDEVAILRTAVQQRADKPILLTEDPRLQGVRFAAASWTWNYRTDEVTLENILCFIDQHVGQGREGIIPGEAYNQVCTAWVEPG